MSNRNCPTTLEATLQTVARLTGEIDSHVWLMNNTPLGCMNPEMHVQAEAIRISRLAVELGSSVNLVLQLSAQAELPFGSSPKTSRLRVA